MLAFECPVENMPQPLMQMQWAPYIVVCRSAASSKCTEMLTQRNKSLHNATPEKKTKEHHHSWNPNVSRRIVWGAVRETQTYGDLCGSHWSNRELLKIRGTILGVLIIKILAFWGPPVPDPIVKMRARTPLPGTCT